MSRSNSDNACLEEKFHDNWANSTTVETIDVRQMNEALTAPEMRAIRQALGDLKGKRLLDVGCGLGEASVYFAIEGADVYATDLSNGMLEATARLAKAYSVNVSTHKSSAESLNLGDGILFDVIYVGNLFHHVDIIDTVNRLVKYLAPEGVLISWDPIAYNPIINVYRKIAQDVRTPDEHPLTISDLKFFRSRFDEVHEEYFWLCSLLIFIAMAIVQGRNPNKERFWKKVVEESDDWEWLYTPLARLDKILLKICPFLKIFCWNVVLVCKRPKV